MGANIFLIAIVLIVGGWALYFHIEDKKEEQRTKEIEKKHYFCSMNSKSIGKMKVGDLVHISPDLTMQDNWVDGKVIDVENNSFVGIVVSAKTDNGTIFFGREELFKPA